MCIKNVNIGTSMPPDRRSKGNENKHLLNGLRMSPQSTLYKYRPWIDQNTAQTKQGLAGSSKEKGKEWQNISKPTMKEAI